MKFGENLQNLRKSKKMSQEKLAEKIDVSRQSVSKWERGESYPTMNNIMAICGIFHCKLNDLVHEEIVDFNLLDEEIKMNVVKFKKEKQNKVKGLSKAIYILSRIGKIACTVGITVVIMLMVAIPFSVGNLKFENGNIFVKDVVIGTAKAEEIEQINNLYELHGETLMAIYSEIICACLLVSLFLLEQMLKKSEKLFVNIHNGDTPFTLENVKYIKDIALLLILQIIIPTISGYLMSFIMQIDLEVEFEIVDVISILVIFSMAYIFEYGYEIQQDSKGKIYGDEDE